MRAILVIAGYHLWQRLRFAAGFPIPSRVSVPEMFLARGRRGSVPGIDGEIAAQTLSRIVAHRVVELIVLAVRCEPSSQGSRILADLSQRPFELTQALLACLPFSERPGLPMRTAGRLASGEQNRCEADEKGPWTDRHGLL